MATKWTGQCSGTIHVELRANVNEDREMNKGESLQRQQQSVIVPRQRKNAQLNWDKVASDLIGRALGMLASGRYLSEATVYSRVQLILLVNSKGF
jgi:hypothetical protein